MSVAARLRRPWIALALIMTVGAALRALHLTREALWGDEALTLILARWPLGDMIAMPTDNTPPLYYALHRLVGLETEALAAAAPPT